MLRSVTASLIAGAILTIFSVGLGLIWDLFGTRGRLTEISPVLTTFLPHIGIGAIGVAVVSVCIVLKKIDDYRAEIVIADLISFVEAREVYNKWREFVEHFADTEHFEQNADQYYSPEMEYRFMTLGSKYSKWLADNGSINEPWFDVQSARMAHECVEYLRAYGYVMGRWHIRKARKQESV